MPRYTPSVILLCSTLLLVMGCGGMAPSNADPNPALTRGGRSMAPPTRAVDGGGNTESGAFSKGGETATSHSVSVAGGLDARVIQRAMAKHQSAIKACYERELRKNPNLSGKVVVRWVVDLTGAVQGAQVTSSTLSEPKVAECVVQRVNQIRFPKPKGGGKVTISYPFDFRID